jgi:hypothetical protein
MAYPHNILAASSVIPIIANVHKTNKITKLALFIIQPFSRLQHYDYLLILSPQIRLREVAALEVVPTLAGWGRGGRGCAGTP